MSIITKAGIQTRTYEEIVASLEARFKGAFGDAFDTTAEFQSQILAIFGIGIFEFRLNQLC